MPRNFFNDDSHMREAPHFAEQWKRAEEMESAARGMSERIDELREKIAVEINNVVSDGDPRWLATNRDIADRILALVGGMFTEEQVGDLDECVRDGMGSGSLAALADTLTALRAFAARSA